MTEQKTTKKSNVAHSDCDFHPTVSLSCDLDHLQIDDKVDDRKLHYDLNEYVKASMIT